MYSGDNSYEYQFKNWLKKLSSLQEENVALKTQLGYIVRKNVNTEALEKIEYFQGRFLNKDILISILRREIKQLQNNQHTSQKDILAIGEDLELMQEQFTQLKNDFYSFIASI